MPKNVTQTNMEPNSNPIIFRDSGQLRVPILKFAAKQQPTTASQKISYAKFHKILIYRV